MWIQDKQGPTKIHGYPFMLGGYMNAFDFFHNAGDGIESDKLIWGMH
jgi:hypothetical protein